MCNKCWQFMIVAYKILNTILREDFNFQHIMWIFSGRRGIHCWVSDERARTLTNEGRSSISNYIKIKTMNSKTGVGSTLKNPIHPTHLKSLEIIPFFDLIGLEVNTCVYDPSSSFFSTVTKYSSPGGTIAK